MSQIEPPPPTGPAREGNTELNSQIDALLGAMEEGDATPPLTVVPSVAEKLPEDVEQLAAELSELMQPAGAAPCVTPPPPKATPVAAVVEPMVAGPSIFQRASAVLLGVLASVSRPITTRPKAVRRAVGLIALNTFVLGGGLWAYVLFFRPVPTATHAGTFNFADGHLPPVPEPKPPEPKDHAAAGHDDHGKAKDAGHGEAKKPDAKKKKANAKEAAHGGGH